MSAQTSALHALQGNLFASALGQFFHEEALILDDLAPTVLHEYVRVIWWEGKRNGWDCIDGGMDDLMQALLSGDIAPQCAPQPQAAKAMVIATRNILNDAIGPASAAVVADRALSLSLMQFPAARDALMAALR
jgi:hypothetical protein